MVAPSSLEHERNTPLFVVAKLGLEFSYFSERNLKLSTSYPVKHDTRVWQPWDNWTRSLLMPPCFMHNNDQVQKQLGKFFNRQLHIPWVNLIWSSHYLNNLPQHANLCGSFWWKDIVQLETLVRGSAHPIINNGASVSFWNDLFNGRVMAQAFPILFSFAKHKYDSVAQHLARSVDDQFFLPSQLKLMMSTRSTCMTYHRLQSPLSLIHGDTCGEMILTLLRNSTCFVSCQSSRHLYVGFGNVKLLWRSKFLLG